MHGWRATYFKSIFSNIRVEYILVYNLQLTTTSALVPKVCGHSFNYSLDANSCSSKWYFSRKSRASRRFQGLSRAWVNPCIIYWQVFKVILVEISFRVKYTKHFWDMNKILFYVFTLEVQN